MKFKVPYVPNERQKIKFEKPSLTDFSQQKDADINYIIEQYVRTGEIKTSPMQYLDCTTVDDYQTAMYKVSEANTAFESLPSKVRDEFKTVSNYLQYIADPENVQDCVNRGLINPDSVPEQIIEEIQKSNLAGKKFSPKEFFEAPPVLNSETITNSVVSTETKTD